MAFYECIDKVRPFITTETVFDDVITFNDTYGNIPLVTCDSLISGYQEGSGTPSPDNVRPLHAFSSATLTENGNTHTFTFGQSIYQGEIDWNNGIIRGDWLIVDMTLLDWNYTTAYENPFFYCSFNGIDRTIDLVSIISSCYEGIPSRTAGTFRRQNNDGKISVITNQSWSIALMDFNYTTATDLINSLTGQKIAVKLATPIEIPLGGIQLLTNQGINTYSCNTGDTTVEYINIT